MEKSVMDLPEILEEQFGGRTADIRTYSPLVLAYIGDGIYDLCAMAAASQTNFTKEPAHW